MAVETTLKASSTPRGIKRWLLGTNVLVATLLVVGIVVVVQVMAYNTGKKWDMTSSGINSLSEGTENLLDHLEQNVRLTSLYFETDRETEDQPRYRRAVGDLLGLYAATNRAKIASEWINPLKDHEKVKALVKRLSELPAFKEGIDEYRQCVEAYSKEGGLDARIQIALQGELNQIASLSLTNNPGVQKSIGPIQMLLTQWSDELQATRKAIDAEVLADSPQYTGSVEALKLLYPKLNESLRSIVTHGEREVQTNSALTGPAASYLQGLGGRFTELRDAMTAEGKRLDELETPKIDAVLRELEPTGNAIIVETDNDARVVNFAACWPSMDPGRGGQEADFFHRAFKGEEKLTAAVLRATHKEQTAVVFVRYGGPPLLMGGVMPGQPRGPYMVMKQHLEDANFVVKEWDLKTSDKQPEIVPAPTRTVFVVLKPTASPRDPMGRPSQEPPFTDRHKEALLAAIGENGRALFIAGWSPGPMGPIPSSYEYASYLTDTWGISVDTSYLLMRTVSIAPEKYAADGRNFYLIQDVTAGQHDIVSGPQQQFVFPWCAPLTLAADSGGEVQLVPLIDHAKSDTLWGIKDLSAYEKQLQEKQFMTRIETDLTGPFTLAVAGTKGDAKVVVVSARSFAEDSVAFARELSMGARGLSVRTRNPGNVTLFVNSLHWLSDNTEFLNIGRPIEVSVLQVSKPSTVKVIQALTVVVWPALALLGGAAVWWVRRR